MSIFHGGIILPPATGDLQAISYGDGEVCLLTEQPAVVSGDRVALGQTVGTIGGRAVLSSVSGVVTEADHGRVRIAADGEDRVVEIEPFGRRTGKTLTEATPEELVLEIRNAGIVDATGTPMADRLEKALERSAKGKLRQAAVSLIEPDPASLSLTSLAVDFADAIAGGLTVLLRLLSLREGSILCTKDQPQAVQAIEEACLHSELIAVEVLPARYPQHHPKLITRWLCQKELSHRSTPELAGLFLIDAETCIAIHRLFVTGLPRLCVRTTVYQNEVGKVYDLPIGLPITTLNTDVNASSGAEDVSAKADWVRPREKAAWECGWLDCRPAPDTVDRSLTVLLPAHTSQISVYDCIRCGKCVEVCPMFLQPNRYLPQKPWVALLAGRPRDAVCCIGCGCCSYVCPSHLPLRKYALRAAEEERHRLNKSTSKV